MTTGTGTTAGTTAAHEPRTARLRRLALRIAPARGVRGVAGGRADGRMGPL